MLRACQENSRKNIEGILSHTISYSCNSLVFKIVLYRYCNKQINGTEYNVLKHPNIDHNLVYNKNGISNRLTKDKTPLIYKEFLQTNEKKTNHLMGKP